MAGACQVRVPAGCPLTNSEFDVMVLVASGLQTKQVAAELCRTPSTVKSHVQTVRRKLGVRSRVEAVIVMKDSGWLGALPRLPNVEDPPLTHGQLLYLRAFDELLRTRSREAEAAVTVCFAALCWECGARPVRRPADIDGLLLRLARGLTR